MKRGASSRTREMIYVQWVYLGVGGHGVVIDRQSVAH